MAHILAGPRLGRRSLPARPNYFSGTYQSANRGQPGVQTEEISEGKVCLSVQTQTVRSLGRSEVRTQRGSRSAGLALAPSRVLPGRT